MLSKKKSIKRKDNKSIIILFLCIIVALIISNIYFIHIYNKEKNNEIVDEVLFKETKDEFDSSKKYYATISYKKFKILYKSKDVATVAILDNTTNTHDMFIKMINKIAYYKNTKIYLLQINKLSKKDTISFYELDDRLSKLETNYIISINDKKILSITTFDNEKINEIVEGIGD